MAQENTARSIDFQPFRSADDLFNFQEDLLKERYTVLGPPFGWFNELEIKAKGHPLSRISRRIE